CSHPNLEPYGFFGALWIRTLQSSRSRHKSPGGIAGPVSGTQRFLRGDGRAIEGENAQGAGTKRPTFT
ncbi:MAG: hypothetical protein AAF645_21310, partial [Myxococcota bacterium]